MRLWGTTHNALRALIRQELRTRMRVRLPSPLSPLPSPLSRLPLHHPLVMRTETPASACSSMPRWNTGTLLLFTLTVTLLSLTLTL